MELHCRTSTPSSSFCSQDWVGVGEQCAPDGCAQPDKTAGIFWGQTSTGPPPRSLPEALLSKATPLGSLDLCSRFHSVLSTTS